jgi:rod shape-determining protein MreD
MKIFFRILHMIILVVCIILQLSFVEHLRVSGISMDLIAVMIIGIAIFDDVIPAMLYGLFAGLVMDLITGNIIGISALIYSLNGFIAGSVIRLWDRRRIVNYVLIVFFITEINLLLSSGIYYLFNFDVSFRGLALELIVNPVLNIVAMFLIFPLLGAGRDRKEELGFIYKDKV